MTQIMFVSFAVPAADVAIHVVCPSARHDAERLLENSVDGALRSQAPHTKVTLCLTLSFVCFEFSRSSSHSVSFEDAH